MFRVVAFSDQAQREQWLEEVDKIVDTVLAIRMVDSRRMVI
jgi:hypothetical protein